MIKVIPVSFYVGLSWPTQTLAKNTLRPAPTALYTLYCIQLQLSIQVFVFLSHFWEKDFILTVKTS